MVWRRKSILISADTKSSVEPEGVDPSFACCTQPFMFTWRGTPQVLLGTEIDCPRMLGQSQISVLKHTSNDFISSFTTICPCSVAVHTHNPRIFGSMCLTMQCRTRTKSSSRQALFCTLPALNLLKLPQRCPCK